MIDTLRGFKIVLQRLKKRNQRGKGIKIIGIKSLECNFNPVKRTYNPHLHLIVPDKETGEILLAEWLKLFTTRFATRPAQDIRKITNIETALVEVVKYCSKIFTEPDNKKTSSKKIGSRVYVSALDNIIWSMKGIRVFDRFGFNLPEQQKRKSRGLSILSDYKEWNYDLKSNNWIDEESEMKLTNYVPSMELIDLIENEFDLELD